MTSNPSKIISLQELINAQVDAYKLELIMNEAPWVEVTTRLGRKCYSIATIQGVIDQYKILADQELDNLKDVIEIAAAAGAGANGWTDLLVQTWSGRTQEDKNKDVVHAKDFGLIGLGDETQKIKDLVAYAKQNKSLIVLGGQVTYSFSGSIDIDNVKIITNGATFSRLDAGGGWSIDIGANTNITELKLQVAGGIGQYGVRIKDNNVNIGAITATASNQATYGFRCGFTSKLKNVKVGRIELVNFTSQAQIFNTKNCEFGDIFIENYVTGVYIQDALRLQINSITASICDTVNATGGAGNNGLLVESRSHRATRNLNIGNISIEDSAEHGVRFGGAYTIEDVFIGDVYTKNTGSLVGVSTGGASFKILGSRPDNTVPYNLHKNFHINSITSVDCQTDGVGAGNHVALNLGWCERIYIGQHTVKKENKAYSSWRAVQFQGCSNIHIQNVDYDYCRENAVRFTAMVVPETEQDTWEFCSNINIYSGKIVQRSLGNSAIYFTGTVVKYANINIKASVTADILARAEALTGTGLYSKIKLDLTSNYFGATTPSVLALQLPSTTDAFICHILGKFYNGSCSDGSTWTDPTDAAIYRTRVGASWLNNDRAIRSYNLADDAVLKIIPPYTGGFMNVLCATSFQYITVAFRLFMGANITKVTGSANTAVTANTVPTGTTGTDGSVTIYTSTTDGCLYIENRLGSLNSLLVSFS